MGIYFFTRISLIFGICTLVFVFFCVPRCSCFFLEVLGENSTFLKKLSPEKSFAENFSFENSFGKVRLKAFGRLTFAVRSPHLNSQEACSYRIFQFTIHVLELQNSGFWSRGALELAAQQTRWRTRK